ncbi:CRISPR-associated endoribonuclease Cas2 [Fibrobacterales bacterium]|nr:CRISPR-associated endoribonuclease Cas2 [Fibrobacterales bacterium]
MNRESVLLVFFDLPVTEKLQRKNAVKFRKNLIRQGFSALQESVYYKALNNISNTNAEINDIKKNSPQDGSIFALSLSAGVFERMHTISGKSPDINFGNFILEV